jgi:hypothetical protein
METKMKNIQLKSNVKQIEKLEKLFVAACCRPGEEWDSERRVEAWNALSAFADELLPQTELGLLAEYCLKATLDESVNFTHKLCKEYLN